MSKIRIVNLSNYTTPQAKEDNRKEWVEYGDDNLYYDYLISQYHGSATNNAIINGVTELIYGKGIGATDANRRPDQYAQMISMFSKHCLRRICFDVKALGQATFQIIYNDDKSKVAQVEHFPVETLRMEKCNEDGDVEAFWYSKDWSKIRKKGYEPERIPAFGYGEQGEKIEIYCIKPYRAGFYYYSPVDYQGGLQYAELEAEVANFHINNVRNGLAPSMLINFNNGIPSDEEREVIEHKIIDKFSGSSNSGKFILAFNDNAEAQASIEPVQLSDASSQYEFLSEESREKLMVAHRITSPFLLGIKDSSGMGSNADEIKTASLLFQNTVIRSTQELVLDAMDDILTFNQITLNLYFKTLQPLEFIDYDNLDGETKEEETGRKFSKDNLAEMPSYDTKEEAIAYAQAIGCAGYHEMPNGKFMPCEDHVDLSSDTPDVEDFLEQIGEDEPLENDYELIDVDQESTEDEPEDFDVEKYLNGLVNLSAKDDSSQDSDLYKVRYAYVKGTSKSAEGDTRSFCKSMLRSKKVYRKEDIGFLSSQGVNKSHGHKGKNYSIFKFKGGVNCHHRWERRVYKKKLKKNGEPYGGDALAGTKFVNVNQAVRSGFKLPKNPSEVGKAPIDMPNNGHHPNY
tara:strand:- start:9858 stop:11741 length:1884 start_codon:yes stop_codon:yes gene_type:complete